MNTDDKHILHLLELFFHGRITLDDEKKLREYFECDQVAETLYPYKEFFDYYNTRFIPTEGEITVTARRLSRKHIRKAIWMLSVAVVTLGILIFIPSGNRFDPYEGSYMIVNGKKTCDIELIKEQEKEICGMAVAHEKELGEIYERSYAVEQELKDIMMELK